MPTSPPPSKPPTPKSSSTPPARACSASHMGSCKVCVYRSAGSNCAVVHRRLSRLSCYLLTLNRSHIRIYELPDLIRADRAVQYQSLTLGPLNVSHNPASIREKRRVAPRHTILIPFHKVGWQPPCKRCLPHPQSPQPAAYCFDHSAACSAFRASSAEIVASS